MLQLKDIRKAYTTDAFTQVALDNVSVTFRDNEFVAILGPSGSGKTTMLNILGGLDHADSGDIIINGTSTKDYSAKDWDTYRNHRVGFIFQSYNLIPHQSILSNVELALTLSGIGAGERRARAKRALGRVGLGEHVHKRPSQLSGGQMQRVAIARALVNDPNIILADEPTGALDTETGIQVMNILQEVAQDRLVVMVTHNPELAEQYATRIVRVKDGCVVDDTDPLSDADLFSASVQDGRADSAREAAKGSRHASMSFLTALSLSFNNLMTKKGRTALTAFAGSIGIIGIAAILALSNGVNNYIARTEENALSSYPLTITKSSFDLTSLLGTTATYEGSNEDADGSKSSDDVIPQRSIMTDMFAKVKNNDLSAFKDYLESGESDMGSYVNAIHYSYGIVPQIYMANTSDGITRLNPSKMSQTMSNGVMGSALMGGMSSSSFSELIDNEDLLESQMQLVEGHWPQGYDEAVLVLNHNGGVSDYTLYSLGFYDPSVMDTMTQEALNGDEVTVPDTSKDFTYEDALGLSFKVVPSSSLYQKNTEQGTWTDMTGDDDYMRNAIENGIDLKVVGVVKPSGGAGASLASEGIGYTAALTSELMRRADESQIVQEQKANSDVDVFTGKTFEELQSSQKSQFDLSSMFSVDEDALKDAFSFDTSVLGSLGADGMESLDLSNMEMPDMSSMMSGMGDMSGDAAQKLSESLTSALSAEAIANAFVDSLKNAPEYSAFEKGAALSAEQEKAIQALGSGFVTWLLQQDGVTWDKLPSAEEMSAYFQKYVSGEGKELVDRLKERLGEGVSLDELKTLPEFLTKRYVPAVLENVKNSLITTAANAIGPALASQMQSMVSEVTNQLGSSLSNAISSQLQGQLSKLEDAMNTGFSFDASAFSNAIKLNMTQDDLTSLLTNYMNSNELSYASDLKKLGYADVGDPESISIYPKNFQAKESVLKVVDSYNARKTSEGHEDQAIQYTDIAGTLMSSVTDIVDMVSLVLIAFVSISLVVSSIMIGIITYISVLERKKEIGILRAMGASKLNVANVFNAETVIEGLISGLFAVLFVYLLSIPVNAVVLQTQHVEGIMALPVQDALALVAISVALTFIAGLMPAMNAARRDPVEALRSE